MKRELYRRWLDDVRGLTLSEFVAERRAEVRQQRMQRRFNREMGPLLQHAQASDNLKRQLAASYPGNLQLAYQRALALNGIIGGAVASFFGGGTDP